MRGYCVVNQKKILSEYLEQFFEDPHEVVDYYIDDGLTGTDDTRASFVRMIQDIERGRVSCVICKTLARAFRNYSDQGYYIEYYFPQKNVRFISTGDPKIDTYNNPEAITGLEVPITGLMNDRFAARTSSDVRRTFNTKRRNGEFIGAFPPCGYLKITREEYKRMKVKFDDQMAQLNGSVSKLEEEQRSMDASVSLDTKVFSEFCRRGNITKLNRNILIELIDTIYVHDNNEITVKFRYEDQLQRILEIVSLNNLNDKKL